MKLLDRRVDPQRQPVMHCKECGAATLQRKDYCAEHVEKHPYVIELLARFARFDADYAALLRGENLPLTSEVVQDMVTVLSSTDKAGNQTSVGQLNRHYEVDLERGDDKKIMACLRKLGFSFTQDGKGWYLNVSS